MTDRYRNTPINQIPADVPVNIPLATDYQFPSYEMMTNSILPPIGVDPLASRSLSARSMPESSLPLWMVPFAAAAGIGSRRGPRPASEISNLVREHRSRLNPVGRRVDPPGIPVTQENLIPMMDRHGLELSRAHGRPGGTQYFTFRDRQGFLPLTVRNQLGSSEMVPNPRFTVRIPDPSDVHAVDMRNVLGSVGNSASARMGRYYDTAWLPGRVTTLDRNLSLDRFGRTLGDIRNLEGELVNRHFPEYRRPARANPPRQSRDPNQLSFLRALLGE